MTDNFTVTFYDETGNGRVIPEHKFTENQRRAIRFISERVGKEPKQPVPSSHAPVASAPVAGFSNADQDKIARRATARAQGYTGDACDKCLMFVMKQAGHCLVCENCGETTGCS